VQSLVSVDLAIFRRAICKLHALQRSANNRRAPDDRPISPQLFHNANSLAKCLELEATISATFGLCANRHREGRRREKLCRQPVHRTPPRRRFGLHIRIETSPLISAPPARGGCRGVEFAGLRLYQLDELIHGVDLH
jgi:hypothetical protein